MEVAQSGGSREGISKPDPITMSSTKYALVSTSKPSPLAPAPPSCLPPVPWRPPLPYQPPLPQPPLPRQRPQPYLPPSALPPRKGLCLHLHGHLSSIVHVILYSICHFIFIPDLLWILYTCTLKPENRLPAQGQARHAATPAAAAVAAAVTAAASLLLPHCCCLTVCRLHHWLSA